MYRINELKKKRVDKRDDPEQFEAILKGPQAWTFHAQFTFPIAE
jgi:hypothetical protein